MKTLLIALFWLSPSLRAQDIPVISMKDFRTLQQTRPSSFVLVDVRTAEEYKDGHIPGAVNLPFENLPEAAKKLPRDAAIIVTCGCCAFSSCPKVEPGARKLLADGFTNITLLNLPEGLYSWEEAGFPVAKGNDPKRRATMSPFVALAAARGHLKGLAAKDRPFQRYFTMAHLYNDPKVTDSDLFLHRVALFKMVNSLSWKKSLVHPRPLDPEQTVYAVDVRTLGWERPELWNKVAKAYPYALGYERVADEDLKKADAETRGLAGHDLPVLRSDWFIANAGRPPLYYDFLELPDDIRRIEETLGVDADRNFADGKAKRAGFNDSRVSSNNRVVELHQSKDGYYWKSYDFKNSEGRANVGRFPLGPRRSDNPHDDEAFEHAGGEMLWSLPNGQQAYFLTDKNGRRIDSGPTDIVGDPARISGTTAIVPGVSCMNCHSSGIIGFKSSLADLGNSSAFSRSARLKIRQIYPPQEEMAKIVSEQQKRYQEAMRRTAAPLLSGTDRRLEDHSEPVGAAMEKYNKDLSIEAAAAELGLEGHEPLARFIRGDRRLQGIGLAPLAEGGGIKRTLWESQELFGITPFQFTARELGQGAPVGRLGLASFGSRDTVEFVIPLNLKVGDKIEAKWFALQGEFKATQAAADKEGEFFLRFFLAPEGGRAWVPGDYRMEVHVNGSKLREESFVIGK